MTSSPNIQQDYDGEQASRARYGVLGYLCALAFVLYIDRICMSQAGLSIQADLELANWQMSLVYASFTVAYALFEVPTGRMGDRHGSKRVLIRIVLWWSAFTALTGVVWKWSLDTGWTLPWFGGVSLPVAFNFALYLMILIRFLFGAGEAGAMPNIARVLTRWFPPSTRGKAQGLVTTATLVGGALAPMAAAWLIHEVGWRLSFVVFGFLGVGWAAAFVVWYRDDPAHHPWVNPAELRLIHAEGTQAAEHHEPVPWSRALSMPKLWLLGGVITCTAFFSYLFFTWYPSYLVNGRGLGREYASQLASLVLAGGALGSLAGGWLHDVLVRRTGSRFWPRRWLGCLGLACTSSFVAGSIWWEGAFATSLWLAIASFCAHITLPCWWMTVIEFSGKHVGAIFGLLNSMGVPGAVASQIFVGVFTDIRYDLGVRGREQWDPAFWVYTGVVLLGSIGWLFIDPVRKLEEESAPPPAPPDATGA